MNLVSASHLNQPVGWAGISGPPQIRSVGMSTCPPYRATERNEPTGGADKRSAVMRASFVPYKVHTLKRRVDLDASHLTNVRFISW
jgi:hypothetical protein